MKARATRRMPRRMDNSHLNAATGNRVAVLNELIDGAALRHGHSDPLFLQIQLLKYEQVCFVNRSRRLHLFLQFADCPDMINVRMRANDLFRRQAVLGEMHKNLVRIPTWIDNQGFAGQFVPQDRAVTLKPANRERFDDHLVTSLDLLRLPSAYRTSPRRGC